MPLRTCSINTRPLVGAPTGSVFFGPRVRCQTNVLAMSQLLPLRARAIWDARHLDATLPGNLLDCGELAQSIEGSAHHVVRVRRPKTLGQDVLDAGALEHRAHRSAGDDAGTGRRWLHEHPTRAVLAYHLVRNRSASERHAHAVTTCRIDRFADGLGHLVRLAGRDAHLALPIPDGDERVEREAPTALHDLRDAIDRDDVLDEVAAFALPTRAAASITATASAVASTAAISASASATTPAGATGAATTAATTTAAAASPATTTGPAAAAWTTTGAAATTAATTAATWRLRRLSAALAALLILSHVRTPVRPRGRHRPLPSRGRDIGIQRGRRRPS